MANKLALFENKGFVLPANASLARKDCRQLMDGLFDHAMHSNILLESTAAEKTLTLVRQLERAITRQEEQITAAGAPSVQQQILWLVPDVQRKVRMQRQWAHLLDQKQQQTQTWNIVSSLNDAAADTDHYARCCTLLTIEEFLDALCDQEEEGATEFELPMFQYVVLEDIEALLWEAAQQTDAIQQVLRACAIVVWASGERVGGDIEDWLFGCGSRRRLVKLEGIANIQKI